jgi:hypothetical protein
VATEYQPLGTLRALPTLARVTVLLLIGTLLQKFVPMTRWGHLLGTPGRPDSTNHRDQKSLAPGDVMALEHALGQGARILPYTPSCLAQAFAGQRMLISQGIPGTVTIGLRPEGKSNWPAHAWLHAGGRVITGGGVGEVYFPTTSYRWPTTSPRSTTLDSSPTQ